MPNIDLRFIVLLVGVMGLLMSVIIFFLRRSLPPSIEGLREWAAAPAIVLVSMVLLAMRGVIPDFLSNLCGNFLLLVGCLLFHVGTQRFFGVATERSLRTWLTVLILSVPALAWYGLIEPDYAVRLRLMVALMFAIFVSLALMVRKQSGRTFAGRFAAAVLFVQSAVILLRFIATFVWPSGTGLFEPFAYQTLYIASFTFTMLLLTVGTVLLATERMRVEFEDIINDAKKAETALRESEGRFRNLLKDIPSVAVQGYLQDGTTSYWNRASEDLYGYGREEAVGRSLLDLIIPVEMHDGVREAMRGMFETTTPIPAGEISLMRKDGSRVDVFSSHAYVHVPGRPPEMFCLDIDITERKRAELDIKTLNANLEERVQRRTADLEAANQLLTQAKIQAEAANIAKSAFLANMSHEIRTPMNGIVGMASILRREGVTSKQAQRLDTIDASAQHLLSVINDVLDISKIEAGKFTLEEAPVVISSLLANVSSILSERVKAKGLHLLIETEPLPHNLVGDPTRLQQALLNYATNAVKFTEQGSVTLRILKQEETADSLVVRFEVTDTGIGIAPDAMSRLFSAFEQADNSMNRRYGGTGLGLAITRRMAELMGGEVGAKSTAGVGSTFWFTVKLTKSGEIAVAPLEAAVDAEEEIRQRYSGHRVLVVDDEPVNREVAVMQLEAVDLVADTAEDGAEAVAMARNNSYVAIFMDMQMPKLNGVEATQEIRQIPGYRDTPIIAMTANAFAEDKAKCLEAGMNDFLTKPFTPPELFVTLQRSLSRDSF